MLTLEVASRMMQSFPLPEANVKSSVSWMFVLVMASTCAASACASGRRTSASLNPNRITTAEIEEAQKNGLNNAYELIQRARPRWLQIRSDRSLRLETIILVYQNESRLGGIEVLRGLPLVGISSMRYLDAAQAGLLPGAGSAHVEGAIVIATTLRGSER
jgi:hypothetical protein